MVVKEEDDDDDDDGVAMETSSASSKSDGVDCAGDATVAAATRRITASSDMSAAGVEAAEGIDHGHDNRAVDNGIATTAVEGVSKSSSGGGGDRRP
jgi:hypothetical protein